jgi:hypothetical protein
MAGTTEKLDSADQMTKKAPNPIANRNPGRAVITWITRASTLPSGSDALREVTAHYQLIPAQRMNEH